MLSVQFSRTVVSDFLWPHGLQYTRLPCPLLSPKICSNSCPLSWRCHPTILILCHPLLLLPSLFLSIRSFPMSQLFASGGQSTGVSASASVLPMNIQGWFLYNWLAWSPCRVRDSQESSPAPPFESINSALLSLLYPPCLLHNQSSWLPICVLARQKKRI